LKWPGWFGMKHRFVDASRPENNSETRPVCLINRCLIFCLGCKRSLVQIQSRRPLQNLENTDICERIPGDFSSPLFLKFHQNYPLISLSIRKRIRKLKSTDFSQASAQIKRLFTVILNPLPENRKWVQQIIQQ
jgi:hypothetical protein